MSNFNSNPYIALLRPNQYLKNLFIFLPIFFALRINDVHLLLKGATAFVAVSLCASSVYIFNDYFDIEADRQHPKKKYRPLASGTVSIKSAWTILIIMFVLGLGTSLTLNIGVFYTIAAYFVLNVLYSLKLKHIPIIDVSIIAVGFVLRLFAGSEATGVPLSMWIILVTYLLALFIALAKRRDDVLAFLETGKKTRKSIDGYNLEFLNSSMMVMASVVIVSYIMYTISAEVITKMHTNKLYLTVIFVILGILRYMQIAFVENKSGSPTDILVKDRFIQFVLIGWILMFGVLIYH